LKTIPQCCAHSVGRDVSLSTQEIQLFRNKMLKQIRGHWYKPTYPFFFSDINYIDKKIDQIILEQVPCEEFYEKMAAILNKMAAIKVGVQLVFNII
jgi:hypothetical protein